jgi:four helix bundle protein
MARTAFEELEVYRRSEDVADRIWEMVSGWDHFAKHAVGMQLVRAADSIGANIAEGAGRGTYKDDKRCVYISRGSLNETKHFLRRSYRRNLMTAEQVEQLRPVLDQLAPQLNACLKSIDPIHNANRNH